MAMLSWLKSSENLFFGAFMVYLCMQFAITATAPHTMWFYGGVVPAALLYGWHHPHAVRAMLSYPSMRWMLLFFGYIVVHALVMAGVHGDTGKVIRNAVATAAFFGTAALFFSTLKDIHRHRLFCAIGGVAGICAAVSIFFFLSDPAAEERMRPIGRANTQVLGAFVYTIGAICALGALCASQKRILNIALCLSLAVIGVAILLTQSRVALAMLVFSMVLGGIYACRNHVRHLIVVGLFLFTAFAALLLLDNTTASYISALIERGDSYRMELWAATWDKIVEAPWTGHGMLARIDYYMTATFHTNSPHNIYLTTALALGFPGLAVLLVAIGHILWKMARELPLASHSVFFTSLLIANALASGLIDHSRIVKGPSPLWIIFWLPLAMGVAELIRNRRKT